MRLLVIIISLFTIPAYAQKAQVQELRLKPNPYFSNKPDIIYPIIVGRTDSISQAINNEIKSETFFEDYTLMPLKKGLLSWSENGLESIDYKVTYNNIGLLSLFIIREGCGAHCETDYIYFNFDLETGKRLMSKDILTDQQFLKFEQMVFRDKITLLTKYKNEELRTLTIDDKNKDTASYEWAVEEIENCAKEIHMENFSLTKDSIEIIDPCDFPYAITGISPTYELKYSYQTMSSFLNPKIRKRLIK